MSKEEKEYKFSGKVVRCTYDTPDFRIFALDVDSKKYPDIKKNKYNNVTIFGELHELTVGVTYEISAVEQLGKYGMSYKVLNIKRDVPTTEEDMYLFLSEILTPNQAVKKKANLTRHTHMQELLLTMPEEEYMALEKSEKKKPEIDGTEEDTEELPWL